MDWQKARRDGASRSSDEGLVVKLSTPGTSGTGTNPEQLFAAGWSACFEGAMRLAARNMKITLPADLSIDAEVDLLWSEQFSAGKATRWRSSRRHSLDRS